MNCISCVKVKCLLKANQAFTGNLLLGGHICLMVRGGRHIGATTIEKSTGCIRVDFQTSHYHIELPENNNRIFILGVIRE